MRLSAQQASAIGKTATIVMTAVLLSPQEETHKPQVPVLNATTSRVRLEALYHQPAYTPAYAPALTELPEPTVITKDDGKTSIGSASEAEAVLALSQRLPAILAAAGSPASLKLWGVSMALDTPERSSMLSAFLRAREWSVDDAEYMLKQMLTWRRQEGIEQMAASHEADERFPADDIRTVVDADGQRRTYVVLKLGQLSRASFDDVEAFVRYRIAEQERTCEYLGSGAEGGRHWSTAPRGPTYTLVIDCQGLSWGALRDGRKVIGGMKEVFMNYYPDFIGGTLIVNAPGFVSATWGVVSRLMPAWWGVRLGSLDEELEG